MRAAAGSTSFTRDETVTSAGSTRRRRPRNRALTPPGHGPYTRAVGAPGPCFGNESPARIWNRSNGFEAMPLRDLLASDAVFPSLKVTNKKQAIQELCRRQRRSLTGHDEREIFETLLRRERLRLDGRRRRRRDSARQAAEARAHRRPVRAHWTRRSISNRSTASRWTLFFCCSHPKRQAPII
jgi:hypothetical protein